MKTGQIPMRVWVVAGVSVFASFRYCPPAHTDHTSLPDQSREGSLPNILFIVTDDQRYNTIGALGDDNEVFTPHLDSLAAAGTCFTHVYNMGSWQGAVCTASRTMLLTGLPLWAAQQSEDRLNALVATDGLWVQQLRKAGYETFMSGKWGLKTDVNAIFDHVVHCWAGPGQTPQGYNRPLSPADTLWTPWDEKFAGFWKDGKHWSEVLADDGIRYLQQVDKKETPFFMYLSFHAPHDPRQSPKAFIDKYPLNAITLPRNYLDEYPFKEAIGAGTGSRDEQLAPFPRSPYAVKKQIQEYFAIISHLDAQVGRILHALATSGKLRNTYVFFTSDHGLAVGHHGLMGKQNMFDHSMRVPLIVVGPQVPTGQKRDQQIYLQDIVPTTYEIAGIDKPVDMYFNSFLPVIKNKRSRAVYPEVYGGYMTLQRMVRTDRYKLIVYPTAPEILLFDMKNDPEEIRNLSADPRYQKVLQDMKARLLRQQRQLNDTLDLTKVL
jgi:arylsulfatase A-like enzyme